ncbi:MAG TPA: DUF2062 domain-containing protein [Gammaproteobacteria bacterium]|nr:DUF2062 domain-containing protein [Gammaproteobacteria bacterium]
MLRSTRGGAVPRKFLSKIVPDAEQLHAKLHGKWYMRPFDFLWHDPALWYIGRRGTCKAVALGAFLCCLPIPGHMVLAVLGALYWRINMPVAVAAVWINNPLTFGPIYYLGYILGRFLLNPFHPTREVHVPVDHSIRMPELARLWHSAEIWLVGCIAEGIIFAIVAYVVFDVAWRLSISGRWKLRKLERQEEKS